MEQFGLFWIKRFSENNQPEIARKLKSGKWEFLGVGEYTKMVKKIGYSHPFEVLGPVMPRKEETSLKSSVQYWKEEYFRVENELFYTQK